IAAGVQAFLSGKQPEPIRYRVNAPAPAKTAPRYLYHVVKQGDTLSELAERYSSGTSSLRRLNGLGKRSILRVGQKLKVPGGSRPAPTKKRPSYRYHVVKRGDTLSELAQRYGSSTSSLRRLNGLGKRSVLRVGQKLKVPGGSRPAPAKKKPSYRYHVVKRGDTLSELAQRYGSNTSSLRRLNGLGKRSVLRVGRKLKISSSNHYHIVKKGETLSGIALRYKTTVSALRRLNKLSHAALLHYGAKLRVL
ncbi:MAG: LysM peptidoglycan-binding domain-containing protein, partial [Deltaproteobacteria bacterium]|nr:LysM peptidoglycan-binding domain-containing protein [Deltaproteobacteria bacterium]